MSVSLSRDMSRDMSRSVEAFALGLGGFLVLLPVGYPPAGWVRGKHLLSGKERERAGELWRSRGAEPGKCRRCHRDVPAFFLFGSDAKEAPPDALFVVREGVEVERAERLSRPDFKPRLFGHRKPPLATRAVV